MKNNSSYFKNADCEYFPCHAGVDLDEFNCLFCYCPLYFLDENCKGNYKYSSSGKKDCSNCVIPHKVNARDIIIERLRQNGK